MLMRSLKYLRHCHRGRQLMGRIEPAKSLSPVLEAGGMYFANKDLLAVFMEASCCGLPKNTKWHFIAVAVAVDPGSRTLVNSLLLDKVTKVLGVVNEPLTHID